MSSFNTKVIQQRRTMSSMSSDTTTTTTITTTPPIRRTTAATMVPTTTTTVIFQPTKSPRETLFAIYELAQYKANLPMNMLMLQSFMAGIYVGMAGQLFLSVGAGLLGAAVFPVGLVALVLTSAELYTGDTMLFTAAVLGRRVTVRSLLRNWTVAWIGNFIGCLTWSFWITYSSGALQEVGQVALAIQIAEKKALQPWMHVFCKAIGANFMVCLAFWQSITTQDLLSKSMAIWFPIAGFVMMGLEHAVANQCLLPLGMILAGSASKISVGRLLYVLLAATLGNTLGGGVFVGAVGWYVNDSPSAQIMYHNNNLTMGGIKDGIKGKIMEEEGEDEESKPMLASASSSFDSNRDTDCADPQPPRCPTTRTTETKRAVSTMDRIV
ncbi:hypothetical protein ACA910_011158 [Epithemia clementina (nom. ined.)]